MIQGSEDEQAMSAAQNASPEKRPTYQKNRKKKTVAIIGIVVAVVAVAGAGFWAWHETPSFCGAICHTPMDPYLDTYEQESGTAGTDKWGNSVDSTNAMLAVSHRENESEATCLSCHTPTFSEQVSEGVAWITGSYEAKANDTYGAVLNEKSLSDLTAASGADPESFCLNEACHTNDDGTVMTRDDLAKLTSNQKRNPHVDQHSNTTCTDCHKAHRASVNQCSGCHADSTIPEGWLKSSDAATLKQQ